MKKSEGNSGRNENQRRENDGRGSFKNKNKMKKNMQRLGGRGGLSLEAFANAKTRNNNYNPALIKKQREFYQNAKQLRKYKKLLKRQEQQNVSFPAVGQLEGNEETKEGGSASQQNRKRKKSAPSLGELYETNREEKEKARREREAMIKAKKEEREQSEARRRALKERIYKKTKSGQPVMKYRIQHLLETIQGSTS